MSLQDMLETLMDRAVEEWHESDTKLPIHEWIGIDKKDYDAWVCRSLLDQYYCFRRRHEGYDLLTKMGKIVHCFREGVLAELEITDPTCLSVPEDEETRYGWFITDNNYRNIAYFCLPYCGAQYEVHFGLIDVALCKTHVLTVHKRRAGTDEFFSEIYRADYDDPEYCSPSAVAEVIRNSES